MGVRGEAGARAKIQAIIMNIDIPLRNGKVRWTWPGSPRRSADQPGSCMAALHTSSTVSKLLHANCLHLSARMLVVVFCHSSLPCNACCFPDCLQIHFLETMHALAGRVAGTEVPDDEEERIRQRLYPRLPSTDAADVPKYGVSHFYAALYVQAAVRGFLKRHALQQGRASAAGAPPAGQQRKRRSTLEWLQQIGSRAASSDGAASPKQQSKPG